MRVPPEKGEGLAALLLRRWDTYDAPLKADLLQLAERLGCNWWDVVIDCCVKRCGLDMLLIDDSPRAQLPVSSTGQSSR